MAEKLAHRDLRNRSAEILRDVASGATYEITNHGQVVAVLSPAGSRIDLQIRPARLERRFAALSRLQRGQSVVDTLDDLRGDR